MLFQIIKALVTFGPDVVSLIGDIVKSISSEGAGKDRAKAERILYTRAWRIRNGLPDTDKTIQ